MQIGGIQNNSSTEHLIVVKTWMKAIPPISDKTIKTDPYKAATWFIQYEKAIEPILKLGEGTTSQCSLEQCSAVIYQIKERLPHTLLTQAYQLEGNPRE